MYKYIIKEAFGEVYHDLVKYVISNSDCFTLVYVRYSKKDKFKFTLRNIHEQLEPFRIKSMSGGRWPKTIIHPDDTFVYKLTLYKADEKVIPTLLCVDSLSRWKFPELPDDLCFYRNGQCWIATSASYNLFELYSDDLEEIAFIQSIGVSLEYIGKVEDDDIFLVESLGKPATKDEINNRRISNNVL